MLEWKVISIGLEGHAVEINGLNPWRYPWADSGARVVLPHPSYASQRHEMPVYRIEGSDTSFAASEVSNGVWAFYVPDK
jgi:hypothetical protein